MMHHSESIDDFVKRQINSGRYSSRKALIDAALRNLQEQEDELEFLAEKMQSGADAFRRGEDGFPLSLEVVKQRVAERKSGTA